MREVCLRAVQELEVAFLRLESQVPPPRLVPFGQRGEVFRYVEQSVYQALILKYAPVITGLRAIVALLAQGLLQEVGCIQRVLDEVAEDIYFLAASVKNGERTDKHERYLASFWGEQFPDPDNTMARLTKPDAVPRSKIVGYVHGTLLGPEIGSSQAADASHNLSSTYGRGSDGESVCRRRPCRNALRFDRALSRGIWCKRGRRSFASPWTEAKACYRCLRPVSARHAPYCSTYPALCCSLRLDRFAKQVART